MRVLESALHDLANALREIVNVVAVQARHRDAAVGCHVDVCLLREGLGLRLCEASEAVVWRSVSETSSHGGREKNQRRT